MPLLHCATHKHFGGAAMIEPTEQELQMIEIIREQKSNFRLVIGSEDGAWEVALSVPSFRSDPVRGVGASFTDAWDDMGPTHV
jgi:hypothetical protein